MYSVITNIVITRKPKAYFNRIVHSHRKTEKGFFGQLEMLDVYTRGQKNFFSFSVAVRNSIKVGPFVFLL
jgi:hypothetical protein